MCLAGRMFLVAAMLVASALPLGAEPLRLMTGPQGGTWAPLGAALKTVWERTIPDVRIKTYPGAGISNVRGIQESRAEIGFANSISTVDGVNGEEPFSERQTGVCNLATLYPQYLQIIALAKSSIRSGKDFRGKTLVAQQRGSTAEQVTQHFLRVYGLKYEDLRRVHYISDYVEATNLLRDSEADGLILGTSVPSPVVKSLLAIRDIRLIGVDDASFAAMRKINRGYTRVVVPAGTYPKQDRDVASIGYVTHLAVACALPEPMVYALAKAIAENVAELSAVTTAVVGLTARQMGEDIGVPLHPGASRFYREHGQ